MSFRNQPAVEAKLLRRLWFDRSHWNPACSCSSFDEKGALITDVAYFNEQRLAAARRFRCRAELRLPVRRTSTSSVLLIRMRVQWT